MKIWKDSASQNVRLLKHAGLRDKGKLRIGNEWVLKFKVIKSKAGTACQQSVSVIQLALLRVRLRLPTITLRSTPTECDDFRSPWVQSAELLGQQICSRVIKQENRAHPKRFGAFRQY